MVDASEGLADVLDAFAAINEAVARLYKSPPDQGVVSFFRDFADEDDLFCRDEQCLEGIRLMSGFCREGEPEQDVQVATADQNHLFVGPDHLPSPPWSSVYLDRGLLFGPTTFEVEREFRRHGFWIPEGDHEPCDHISYELQFIAEMDKKAAEELRQGDLETAMSSLEEGTHFVRTYLLPWADKFSERVQQHAATGLYQGLAILTTGLIGLQAGPLNIAIQDEGLTKGQEDDAGSVMEDEHG
jgi:TorA maturation chaperone TorD